MKENLCIITGPTGVGKTKLSIEIAKELNGEIISCDSMQIYKYMDIGTDKIKAQDMDNVSHHLIDFLYPDEEFTVADFMSQAKNKIRTINNKNKLPIVVGGTGLYLNSLVYDLDFTKTAYDEKVREKYEKIAEEKGLEYLHSLLKEVDFERSIKLDKNDKQRVIRALEIHEITGKTMSEYNKDFRKENKDYNLIMICLNMDRQKLYERINKRVDFMIDQGLVEEVKSLLEMGYKQDSIALQGIGYKELVLYLKGEMSLEDSINLIKQKSRNYAKRQLTWFRRDDRYKWIDRDDFKDFNSLKKYIKEYIFDNMV